MAINSKFEELLTKLGTGKWNFLYIMTASYCYLLVPSQMLNGVYLAPAVDHTCIPPVGLNVTDISEDSCRYYVNETTPFGDILRQEVPCTEWEFNTSVYTSTLTSEFNLVCDRAYLRATYQSMNSMVGIVAKPLCGVMADRFGRKPTLVVTVTMFSTIAIAISLVRNFTAILALRLMQGLFPLTILYILCLEVCEVKNRSVVGILTGLPWAFGTMWWGALAYLIRDWQYLQLSATLPFILMAPLIYLIDEPPRWLILKGKHDQALKVLRKASRWNKKELPPDEELRKTFLLIQQEQLAARRKHDGKVIQSVEKRKICRAPELLSTPRIRLLTAICCLNLLISDFVFSGVTLSGDTYSADPFLFIIFGGLAELPSYLFPAPLINWLGRKTPTIISYVIGGITPLALAVIPTSMPWLVMTFVMLFKLSISASFMILFVYISELFPTQVRIQGVGVSTACGQIGVIIAPYVTNIVGPKIPWLPSVLFGILSLVAGLSLIPLPETLGASMPDAIQDLESQQWKFFKSREPLGDEEEMAKLTTRSRPSKSQLPSLPP